MPRLVQLIGGPRAGEQVEWPDFVRVVRMLDRRVVPGPGHRGEYPEGEYRIALWAGQVGGPLGAVWRDQEALMWGAEALLWEAGETVVFDLRMSDEHRCDASSDEAQAEIAAWREILDGAKRTSRTSRAT